MDEIRMGVVKALQKARARTFDGPPYRPWETQGHSLPPVEPSAAKRVLSRTLSENPNLERAVKPDGKAKWVLSASAIAEVRKRLADGETPLAISNAMLLSRSTITRIGQKMRKHMVVAEPVVAVPVAAPVECPPVAQVVRVTPAPESVRTHVLDWKARFAAIKYPDPPAGCLPKKRPKKVKVMTAGQIRTSTYDVVHAGSNHVGMAVNSTPVRAINCAAPAKDFAGEKVFDVERSWRETCSQ